MLGGAPWPGFDDEGLSSHARSHRGATSPCCWIFTWTAPELDVDLVCDGRMFSSPVMAHIEEAASSGDSFAVFPAMGIESVPKRCGRRAELALVGVHGLMNLQWAIKDGIAYCLEANQGPTHRAIHQQSHGRWAGVAARVGWANPYRAKRRRESLPWP